MTYITSQEVPIIGNNIDMLSTTSISKVSILRITSIDISTEWQRYPYIVSLTIFYSHYHNTWLKREIPHEIL